MSRACASRRVARRVVVATTARAKTRARCVAALGRRRDDDGEGDDAREAKIEARTETTSARGERRRAARARRDGAEGAGRAGRGDATASGRERTSAGAATDEGEGPDGDAGEGGEDDQLQ